MEGHEKPDQKMLHFLVYHSFRGHLATLKDVVNFYRNVFTINAFFQSSGYCWCVNSTSGRPIPGTSLHNARPNCEAQTGGKEPFQIYLSTNLNANLCIHINHSNFFGPQSVPVLQSRFGTSSVLFPLPKIILVQFQFRSRSKIFSKSYKY